MSKWMQNQQNPPLPKKKRVDTQGNARRRIFAKSGTATLLLVSGITQPGADAFISSMIENAKKLGGKCECEFRVCQ
jgi:hypothetical protein